MRRVCRSGCRKINRLDALQAALGLAEVALLDNLHGDPLQGLRVHRLPHLPAGALA